MNKRLSTLVAAASVVAVTAAGAGAAFASDTPIPAQSVGTGMGNLNTPAVSAIRVAVPEIRAPGCGASCDIRAEVAPQSVATPHVERIAVATPDIPVPGSCAGMLACIGSFSVPGVTVGRTPEVASRVVTTPRVKLPESCATASVACDGIAMQGWTVAYTPAVQSIGLTPPISVSLEASGWNAATETHYGETWAIPPRLVNVNVPFIGPVPITLFPQGLSLPMLPQVGLVGDFILTVNVGRMRYSQVVPVTL